MAAPHGDVGAHRTLGRLMVGVRRSRPLVALVALLTLVLVAAACGRDEDDDAATPQQTTQPPDGGPQTTVAPDMCESEPLQATEVGVTEDEITVFVMADVGSPLAPGLFQGSIDAVKAWADHVNEQGGVGCRKVVVREWDSKVSPDDTTNGTIDACQNAFAMIGTTSLFVL
ncbi:MAG TPA: hypothetical protein VF183_03835, partial [Acidimicrobiales bacterium]